MSGSSLLRTALSGKCSPPDPVTVPRLSNSVPSSAFENRLSASQLQIRYNTLASNSGGQLVKIQSVYTHPEYNQGAQVNNDVALLRTASKMTLGGVNAQVIPLADPKSDPSSGELLISGWGDLREGANAGTTTLQVVQVPLISRPRCQSLYAGTYTINENMLCAAIPEGGKDSCQGKKTA